MAARTSSSRFREAGPDVRAIGDSLDVGAVLEGGVRRAGDRLKLSVRLVETGSGTLVWSGSFERPLEMGALLRIQEEVARSIAGALEVRLTEAASRRIARLPTEDLRAYSLFLRARGAAERRTPDGFARALDRFRRAVGLQPSYPTARQALALLLATHGRTEEARRVLASHEALALRGAPDTAWATVEAAWIHAALGEVDSAFAWFRRFEAWNSPELLVLRADPLVEPIRRDPRYRELVERADRGFPVPVEAGAPDADP